MLAEGASADEQELIDHVRSWIARFEAPDTIEFLAELPRT
jgi:fatty-acyl-CoA synthase